MYVNGRYFKKPVVNKTYTQHSVILRLDDEQNLDQWLEIEIVRSELVEMIKEIDNKLLEAN